MKIMCSGEIFTEELDHSACLRCALDHKGRQPCGLSYPLLKALFKYESSEERRGEIHVTDLTTCLLLSYMRKTRVDVFYPHERLLIFLGKAVHQIIEDAVKDDPEFIAEQPLAGFGVVGRADLIGQGSIVDIKTTRWLDRSKGLPYGSHQEQVEIYAALYNASCPNDAKVKNGRVQYIDMSGPTTCRKCRKALRLVAGMPTCPSCGGANPKGHLGALMVDFPIQRGDEIAQSMQLRAGMLRDALESGSAPEPERGWICDYCPFTKYCPAWE